MKLRNGGVKENNAKMLNFGDLCLYELIVNGRTAGQAAHMFYQRQRRKAAYKQGQELGNRCE